MAITRNNKPVVANIRSVVADAKSARNLGDIGEAVSKLAANTDDVLGSVSRQLVDLSNPYLNAVSSPDALLVHPSHISPNQLAKAVFPVAPVQIISAVGSVISPGSTYVRLSNSSGGSLTLTSAPTIADGLSQQYLVLYNIGTQNIVLQDQGTLASSNLRLVANTRTIAPRQSLALLYSNDIGDWIEQHYSAVI